MTAKQNDQVEQVNEDNEIVGNGNQDKLDRINAIADGVDHANAAEFENLDLQPSTEEVPAEQVEPVSQRYKIKVNGKEREVSLDELIATAQKVEAADEYLAEAKRKAQEVKPHEPITQVEPSMDAQSLPEDDPVVLARTLQMGTEEEAASVIKRIQSRTPSINVDEITQQVRARIDFENDAKWFANEYQDVFQDDNLRSLAILKDQQLIQSGDRRPYRERFKAIGDELRAWKGIAPSIKDKQQRKAATVTTLPTASARASKPVQDDEDDSVEQVITSMARARGQQRN